MHFRFCNNCIDLCTISVAGFPFWGGAERRPHCGHGEIVLQRVHRRRYWGCWVRFRVFHSIATYWQKLARASSYTWLQGRQDPFGAKPKRMERRKSISKFNLSTSTERARAERWTPAAVVWGFRGRVAVVVVCSPVPGWQEGDEWKVFNGKGGLPLAAAALSLSLGVMHFISSFFPAARPNDGGLPQNSITKKENWAQFGRIIKLYGHSGLCVCALVTELVIKSLFKFGYIAFAFDFTFNVSGLWIDLYLKLNCLLAANLLHVPTRALMDLFLHYELWYKRSNARLDQLKTR